MKENIAFTHRAISHFQSAPPADPLIPPIAEYLTKVGRLFIGPGDMVWINVPGGPAQIATGLIDFEA